MPLYYAVYTQISQPETYWWPLNREVPIQFATSLIWANLIGYGLPTVLMFLPWNDPYITQNFETLWQVSPMLVSLFCSILGHVYVKRHNLKQASPTAQKELPDVVHLKRLYVVTGVLGFALHVYSIARILLLPDMSLASVFWPDFTAQPKAMGEGIRSIFLADFYGFEIATYGWLCMAVWDLKRMGRTSVDVGESSTLIALSCFIIGPGATLSAVWYWRETILAKTSFFENTTQ